MLLFRNILSLLLASLLILIPMFILISSIVLFELSLDPDKSMFGCRFYSIISNSMEPAIKRGDTIIVRLCGPEDVRIGEIVTVNPDPNAITTMLTHRLVRILTELDGESGLWFVTKGDANVGEDHPITADQLIGKVIARVPNMGWFKRTPLTAVLVVLLCWGLGVFVLIRLALRGRHKSRPTARRC